MNSSKNDFEHYCWHVRALHADLLSTAGVDFKNKIVEVDGKRIRLNLWDTAGQERFRTVTKGMSFVAPRAAHFSLDSPSFSDRFAAPGTHPPPMLPAYYRGATGIVLVYDLTDEQSFKNIEFWLSNIQMHASEEVEKILIANKTDMFHVRRVRDSVNSDSACSLSRVFLIYSHWSHPIAS